MPSPGDLPSPEIKPGFPELQAGSSELWGKTQHFIISKQNQMHKLFVLYNLLLLHREHTSFSVNHKISTLQKYALYLDFLKYKIKILEKYKL